MNQHLNILRDPKYKSDEVFQAINRIYLTLKDDEARRNSEILKEVIENTMIPLMKQDQIFNDLFERIVYSGSYYKKTKFGHPDEFDLDFLFKLPINYSKVKIHTSNRDLGYVKINLNQMQNPPFFKHSQSLTSWLTNDHFLNQDAFRSWFESVFTKAVNKLPIATPESLKIVKCLIRHKKSGPAFTFIISIRGKDDIHVDLVPALEFTHHLNNNYRPIDSVSKRGGSWLVVPKPVNDNSLWRLSFYEHEKDFLIGDVKDVIRMMKKFRDTQGWSKICSYYIETIFYHLIFDYKNVSEFLHASKTALFMLSLKMLLEALETERLPYFWHPHCNLFDKIDRVTLRDYAFRLRRLMLKTETGENPLFLSDLVLTPNENLLERIVSMKI